MDVTRVLPPRPYRLLAWGLALLLLSFAAGIALVGLGTVTLGGVSDDLGPGGGTVLQDGTVFSQTFTWPVLSLIGMAVSVVAVPLALRWPAYAWLLGLVVPALALAVDRVLPFTAVAGVLCVALVAQWRHPRLAWLFALPVLGYAVALIYLVTMTMPGGNLIYLGFDRVAGRLYVLPGYLFLTALVLGAGHGFRLATRRALDQADLDVARSVVSNDAEVLGERARLARDLHDVVAHHVSLIAVRAETAPYTVADLSPAATAEFAEIARDSRAALDELRGVLGVLRRAEGEPALAPLPGTAQVQGLLEQARGVGDVEVVGEDGLDGLDETTGHVAYRVLQEALTNARRHAPGVPVRVEIRAGEDTVLLRVTNASGQAPVPAAGLSGMRERVDAVGGNLDVAWLDGEVGVEATLPLAISRGELR